MQFQPIMPFARFFFFFLFLIFGKFSKANPKCEDDDSFCYKGKCKKDCDWIGQKQSRINKICPKTSQGSKVSESCPVACGECSGNNNPTPSPTDDSNDSDGTCEDDDSFRFKGKGFKNCEWIGEKASRIQKLCPKQSEGQKVSEACAATCGACAAPTGSPTGSQTSNDPFTPLNPSSGWRYAIEAIRSSPWPSCKHRFLSRTSSCESDSIDLWQDVGANQEWEFVPVDDDGGDSDLFYIKRTECSRENVYLSYDDGSDCTKNDLSFSTSPGDNQQFRFVQDSETPPGHYYIEASGRVGKCPRTWLSFTSSCSSSGPDPLDLWSERGESQYFRIFPTSNGPLTHKPVTEGGCADPSVWYSGDNSFHLLCTGGDLPLYHSPTISESATFHYHGEALYPQLEPEWLQNGCCRWAPENYVVPTTGDNIIFVSDEQEDEGVHRLGYVVSRDGPGNRFWDQYSSDTLALSNSPGGEIDAHVFFDEVNDQTFLLWKSDDNRLGHPVTYLWAQQIEFGTNDGDKPVILVGSPSIILDSTGFWWIKSWVWEGSLIEGPQMIYQDGWYYLFFASGMYW